MRAPRAAAPRRGAPGSRERLHRGVDLLVGVLGSRHAAIIGEAMPLALTSLSHGAGLRLQAAAGRPAADRRRAPAARPTRACSSAPTTADDAGVCPAERRPRARPDRRLLHADRRRPVRRSGASPPPTRCRDVYAMGATPVTRAQPRRLPARGARRRRCSARSCAAARDAVGRRGRDASSAATRSTTPSRSTGSRSPAPCTRTRVLTNAGGAAGRRARPDQAARRRRGGDRDQARAGGRRPGRAGDRGDDDAQRPRRGGRPRGRRPRAHRRHRLRPARAPARAGARPAGWRRRSTPPRCPRSTACSTCSPTSARSRAARGATGRTRRRFTTWAPTACPSRGAGWCATR